MFSFNSLSIKTEEDLQEALQVEHSKDDFKQQMLWMISRWGVTDSLSMLGAALCGNGDLKPLIKFTHRLVIDNLEDVGDEGHLEEIK